MNDPAGSPVSHRYASIVAARQAFQRGDNITATIREREAAETNPQHAIEIAYELQAGSYSQGAERNPDRWQRYGAEVGLHLDPLLKGGDVLLDGGTGEMTSLVSTLNSLDRDVVPAAFDMSWSRVAAGRRFVEDHLNSGPPPDAFVGDLAHIAIADSGVDVAMTIHALEPNGGRERELLQSLVRVARRHVVLFEPCYERANEEARRRMESHGYVRGLEQAIDDVGGRLESVTEFAMPANPLNPTYVFVIAVDDASAPEMTAGQPEYRCPVTATPLTEEQGVMYSLDAGLAYPIVAGIPMLRPEYAMLATTLAAGSDQG